MSGGVGEYNITNISSSLSVIEINKKNPYFGIKASGTHYQYITALSLWMENRTIHITRVEHCPYNVLTLALIFIY